MSNHSAAEAAFDALGDPMRRQILRSLRKGARPVGELAADWFTFARSPIRQDDGGNLSRHAVQVAQHLPRVDHQDPDGSDTQRPFPE